MNWELIKHKLCRLIATTAILLAGAMVSAAAAGSMPLWAALLGLFASVVLLNAVCGILWVPRPAPPRLFCLQRTSGLPCSCRSCAAGTPPDNTPTPIRCDTYNCSKPRTLFGRAGLAAKKALCYNEENEPRM